MCLFPTPNFNVRGIAYQKGVTSFECGACPECLSKRASRIMVRDVYEAMSHVENCMCTLTYDQYVRDKNGRIIGERVADRKVDKRDCQLFIKRLRSYVFRHYGVRIKYRLSAEYGKKTHRPHYHVLIFGWCPPDTVFYKKSKRGSVIYRSALLARLWRHGICTVDAKRVSASIAKYCSKYTSKDKGAEDTFSLCSQGIGVAELMRQFNGLYYMVEGRKYPIPRVVWQNYITDCYAGGFVEFDCRYVNGTDKNRANGSFERSRYLRAAYRYVRDNDPTYQAYLKFWEEEGVRISLRQPSVFDRIRALPDDKYFVYKQQALNCLQKRLMGIPAIAPRSNCRSWYTRWLWEELHIPPCRSPLVLERQVTHSHTPERDFYAPWITERKNYVLNHPVDGYGDNPFVKKVQFQLSFFDKTLDTMPLDMV